MSVPDGEYDATEPDLDTLDENLYELYSVWADSNGVLPTIKGYLQWVDEKY